MDLDTVTAELYAASLDDFMPQRTALSKQAKADGDKDLAATIAKLRKPSVSAWAINMLVRDSPREVDQLLELGAAFRQAQDDLDGAELRGLTRQRQALIGAVVESAREVASDHGRPISEAMSAEIEQTFRAAMADAEAAEAVRGGALTTAISATGLGSLKISDVAATTRPILELVRKPAAKRGAAPKPDPKADAEREEREEQARLAKIAAEQLAEAERAADIAADRLKAADDALQDANARRDEARSALAELKRQIARAEQDLATAEDELADAKEDQKVSKKGLTTAERAVEKARAAQP